MHIRWYQLPSTIKTPPLCLLPVVVESIAAQTLQRKTENSSKLYTSSSGKIYATEKICWSQSQNQIDNYIFKLTKKSMINKNPFGHLVPCCLPVELLFISIFSKLAPASCGSMTAGIFISRSVSSGSQTIL